MTKLLHSILLITYFIICLGGCSKNIPKPIHTTHLMHFLHMDEEDAIRINSKDNPGGNPRGYKMIPFFNVDELGNIFIPNFSLHCIDKYGSNGLYQYSFGRKGEDPGEFQQGINCFSIDKKGDLMVFDHWKKKIVHFETSGKFKKDYPLPQKLKGAHIYKLEVNPITQELNALVR